MTCWNDLQCCPEGECVCGTVTAPTITISGYSGGGWTDVSPCCKQQVFTPNSSLVSRCCYNLFEKTWNQTCTRKAWIPKKLFPVEIMPVSCPPSAAKHCMPDPPLLHVGTRTLTYYEQQKMRFVVQYDKPTITVYFGRDNFTCSGVTSCKWFLKIKVCYMVTSAYEVIIKWLKTQTTVAVNSCFVPNTTFDGTEQSLNYDVSDTCETNWVPDCSSETGEICFERIKIWDTLPADGPIAFTNADIGSECEIKPTCASIAWIEDEYCFAAVASLGDCDPCWRAYSIGTDSVTYTFGGNTVTGIRAFQDCGPFDECIPVLINCNANPTVCPVVSQTLVCQGIEWEDDGEGTCDCLPRQPGWSCGIYDFDENGGLVLCNYFGNFTSLASIWSYTTACPGPGPAFACDPTCCQKFDCNNCSTCEPKYVPNTWTGELLASQEISVTTYCSPFNATMPTCCVTYPTTTLNVDFA